jgi:hypothetical protein
MTDADEANDLLAKDTAENIVLGRMVASGIIPLDIPQIAYLPGDEDRDDKDKGEPDIQAAAPVAGASMNVYPNPFNPVTTISYELANEAQVSLTIYNVRGQAVRELVENKAQRGFNRILWDGRDNGGREVASGVYFSHLRVGQEVTTTRLVLIR